MERKLPSEGFWRSVVNDAMKRAAALGLITLMFITAGRGILSARRCAAWQDDYKRFIYAETLKNSPIVYRREDVDRIIGNKPAGCEQPTSGW